MNIYGTTKKCPKCGNNNFHDQFEENVVAVVNKQALCGISGHEAIVRTCSNCGFVFFELPLDKDQGIGVGG